jgi:hypothetical protein
MKISAVLLALFLVVKIRRCVSFHWVLNYTKGEHDGA